MFITYGDTFLPTPSSYDELYYEIIRMHQNFDNLYSMGEYLLDGQEYYWVEMRVIEEVVSLLFSVHLLLMPLSLNGYNLRIGVFGKLRIERINLLEGWMFLVSKKTEAAPLPF